MQRAVDRAVGVTTVNIDLTGDRVRVSIRAERPIALVGPRGAGADRLRGEIEELAGKPVRLDILEVPGPPQSPG